MGQYRLVRDSDVEQLGERVCDVLERVGLLCQNAELLEALCEWGATVDAQAERPWFPRSLVQRFVRGLREEPEDTVDGEDASFAAPGRPGLGCQIAQLYHDYPTQARRQGNRTDLVELIKLAATLHPDTPAGHCLVQTEVHPRMEALESALVLAE